MLVDNPIMQQPIFGDSSTASSGMDDISDFFHTELFPSSSTTLPSSGVTLSPGASASNSSRASSPSSPSDSMSQILNTPPQQPLHNSFPEVQDPYSFLGGSAANVASSNFGFGFGGGFGGGSGSSSFFNFLDEDLKVDPSTTVPGFSGLDGAGSGAPFDFLNAFSSSAGDIDMGASLSLDALLKATSPSSSSPASSSASGSSSTQSMAIDPQLVDTPSHVTSDDEDEEEDMEESSKKAKSTSKANGKKASKEEEKLTLTIAPVKVGGHGKARKGTVQGGGVTKKVASSSLSTVSSSSTATPLPVPTTTSTSTAAPSSMLSASSSRNKENVSSASSKKSEKDLNEKDDDDDLPADWRPPPEVFQKMTSKEKRQLRNKISARNFRVRRKEYISTLEMDIAERDRLLQAIRSELGSTQSENLALRQEIAALKRALLEGRGSSSPSSTSMPLSPTSMRASSPASSIRGADINLNSTALVSIDDLNLPPPAPLPSRSAADELAARALTAPNASTSTSPTSPSSSLLMPNTQKDLPTSPRVNGGFWGGVSQSGFGGLGGMGGGITPVHTVLMPDLNMRTEANISIGQWVRDVVAANAAAAAANAPPVPAGKQELQENMNPMMQVKGSGQQEEASGAQIPAGFDGFADTNLFTMKTLDAYRMQLWSKMASQQSHNQHHANTHTHHNTATTASHARKHFERELSPSPFTLPSHQPGAQHPNLSGLASSLKPAFFVNSNKPNVPTSNTPSQFSRPPVMGSTLSALLAGKHSHSVPSSSYSSIHASAPAMTYPSPPGSPNLSGKASALGSKDKDKKAVNANAPTPTPAQMQQAQNAMYAAALASTASQTLLGRLGSAFWDAFSGSSSSPSSAASASASTSAHGIGAGSGAKSWDADKVRKVLEGKAVVRVVDVEDAGVGAGAGGSGASSRVVGKAAPVQGQAQPQVKEECNVTAMLEESLRSLTLGKK